METILRRFSFLKNEELGLITKLAFKYVDNEEIIATAEIDANMINYFYTYVVPQLDLMLKARKKYKGKEKKNESKKRHIN